jgi:hypothetical protein
MQLGSEWGEAIERAQPPGFQDARGEGYAAVGDACYQRPRSVVCAASMPRPKRRIAMRATRQDAQPGLALLRLAQGRIADAVTRSAALAVPGPLRRVRYLPASVEILLVAGEIDEARAAARGSRPAAAVNTDLLGAMAAHAEGAVAAAEGRPQAALARSARLNAWAAARAPYIVARLRVSSRARATTAAMPTRPRSSSVTRVAFVDLGATPDIAALDAVGGFGSAARTGCLSASSGAAPRCDRQDEQGDCSRSSSSEKAIDRHVSNIFSKTNVASRAAATAYAASATPHPNLAPSFGRIGGITHIETGR